MGPIPGGGAAMRYLFGLTAGLLTTALVASVSGCGGSGKELPKLVAPVDDKGGAPVVAVPPKSEPEAVAVVGRAVKATTDGHPERIDRAKVNRLKMKGSVIGPGRPIPANRRVEAAWPDRLAQTDVMSEDSGLGTVLIRLRRPVLWVGNTRDGKTTAIEFADLKEKEAALGAEVVGRHWMALLVPLTDARTVVFAAKKDTLDGRPVDVIKAAAPGAPLFTLSFDEKSGLLVRIEFAQVEPGSTVPTQKVFTLRDPRATDGLMLPGRVEYRQNALPLEEWNVESWEFPDRLDDGGFDAPK